MSATYQSYPLATLATLAADNLNRVSADRSANTDAAKELAQRLQAVAAPLALPSVAAPVISALRLSTRGGLDAPVKSMRQFAADVADRLKVAAVAQPPADEYSYLTSFCQRLAASSQVAAQRTAPQPVRPQAV